MMHEFDSDVPVPTTTVRLGSNIELLKGMTVGQSKWWPLEDMKKATRFYRVAKKLKLGIMVRKVDAEDPRGEGVRMWRIDKTETDPIAAAAAAAAALQPAKPRTKPAVKKAAPKPVKRTTKALAQAVAKPAKKKAVKRANAVPSTPAFAAKQAAAAAEK
jgi:hypothetical protein